MNDVATGALTSIPRSCTDGGATAYRPRPRTTTVDIVIPVHNEETALRGCIRVLHRYLTEWFPYEWSITVADNASTDSTRRLAEELAATMTRVRVLHVDRRGRGLALRTAWGFSDADVVAYMDVDLSTGLDALLPLIAPLANGHSDLSIGSRLAAGARTVRGTRREVISRCYNALVRLTHGARFSDAQCGFKAARTEIIRPLLRHVGDDSWFFDTELLLLAEHNGLRVHEVPVDWIEDVDTRVRVGRTAVDDIRGLVRVARNKASGSIRAADLPRRPDPTPTHPDAVTARGRTGLLWQVLSFGVIGVLSTAAHLMLYALFRVWFPLLLANFAALTITTLLNTEANRRSTFLGSGGSTARVHLEGLLVFALYYGFTSGALATAHALVDDIATSTELVVLVLASALGTAGRFVALRVWIFRDSNRKATS